MIRKLRLRVHADVANELVRFAELDSRMVWPNSWNSVMTAAKAIAQPVQAAYEETFGLAYELDEAGLAELAWLSEPDKHTPLPAFEVDVDLIALLKDEYDGEEACDLLLQLLDSLEHLEGCDIHLRLGGRRSTLEEARNIFLEQAEECGYEIVMDDELWIEEDELEEDWHEKEPSSKKKYRNGANNKKVYANGSSHKKQYSNGSSNKKGYANGANNKKEYANGSDSKRKRQTYSWGGLDDEEEGFAQKKRDAGPAELSESAQFFLMYTTLKWPCSMVELNKAWHKALHNSHPDKFPHDPAAHDRTRMLNQGYEELREVIVLAG